MKAVKRTLNFIAGIFLFIILSSETGKMMPSSRTGLDKELPGSHNGLPGNLNTIVCRVSGSSIHENGGCLVFLLEFRNLTGVTGTMNVQADIYLYDTLLSRETTITKRLVFHPKGGTRQKMD